LARFVGLDPGYTHNKTHNTQRTTHNTQHTTHNTQSNTELYTNVRPLTDPPRNINGFPSSRHHPTSLNQKYLPDLETKNRKIGFERWMRLLYVTPHFKGSWEFQFEITTANDKIDNAIHRCCLSASASLNYSKRNSQEMVVRPKLQSCS
jgi:hypothetical protein